METNSSVTSIAGLPVPPKEKVMRWLSHGAVAALGVAGIITFMPYVNKALMLMINGVWGLAELALAAGVTFATIVALVSFAPVYKRFMESCANKATWAVFEWDPITPLVLWLKEVRRDRQQVETEYQNVEGTIVQNQLMIKENREAAETGEKLFKTAVKQYGEDSVQARMAAIEPGRRRQTAENIEKGLEPLNVVHEILKRVVEATQFTERSAELEIDALRQEFKASQSIQRATDSAERALRGRSERKQHAMMAAGIIHNKYATQFGRLRGLEKLSKELINSIDLQKGTYHREALERLERESKFIVSGRSSEPLQIEAKQMGTLPGIKFYDATEAVPVRRNKK